ncbi:MAG: 5-oxoprolinase [Gemmatimonadetes bacterium]|nr:MAG: 5-oxoprolinase [Gemmatimonadota bacterium]
MKLDAVGLEVMAHAFASIAEEMGLVLVHSALSPNIRERRDASAALFDAEGEMIAQAAHIPVHLGALADAVAAIRKLEPSPGELFLLNDPYAGGSHLPDLTLIGAIDIDGRVAGYSVVRAHHSDIGGMTAGSMPAGARELYQEGLVIPPTRLTADLERLVLANVRTPAMRRGDLAAQRAAVERGASGIRALARRHGWAALSDAARELLEYAERRTKSALSRLPSAAPMTATDYLEGDGVIDDDLEIHVRITIQDGIFHADFTGTREAAPGNVNCPIAVTRSAVLFVVRTLLPEDVPMNGGVPRAIQVTAPPGCLVNARPPSAVAAGNGGLGVGGSGLGEGWTYYETIGGGQGAGQGANGPSGVHVGMSNTLNTPIEVLEMEHPLRVRTYALRTGSGGPGQWTGGDGVVREFEALAPMEATLLTERRRHGPAGGAGGQNGKAGANLLNGQRLASKTTMRLAAGDVLRIETPGGGGWGKGREP